MATDHESDIDLFGLLCQFVTFSEWHTPTFGRFDFQVTEDALRKIFPWETTFTCARSGSLSERLYLPSLEVGDEDEGESGSLRYETDLDVMFLPQQAIVRENTEANEQQGRSGESVLAFIENTEEPRYVKLRVNSSCQWSLADDILESEGGCVYISSSKFCDAFRKNLNQFQSAVEAAGPSQLVTSEHLHQFCSFGILESVDLVFAFRCPHWPSSAIEWAERKRNWPPPECVHKILQQGCALVAKGSGVSSTSHLEWRLSFSFAETELAQNLNPVQRRCYLVVKSLIKGLKCNGLPSYCVKCAFFWFLEEADPDIWKNLNLGACILGAIERLARFLQCYELPNYFVKQRNHLQAIPRESCEVISKELIQITRKPISSLANSPKLIKHIESILSNALEEYGYSKFIALLKELPSCPEKKNDLKELLKYHFYNLGLALMKNPKTAPKGLEYMECVVHILKGIGNQTNAFELLCNSLVNSLRRGDVESAAWRLISMRSLGFSDHEIISTLMKATDGIELPANLFHNSGCFYHVQAYENDVTDPNEELLAQAEVMFSKAAELQPTNVSHQVELSMFLYRNDRFEEAIEAAKQGLTLSKSSEELEYLGYGKSEEITLDGNLGYHVQQHDAVQAPALMFAYYVLVACLVELDRNDEALQLMDSYKTACSDPRRTNDNDDSLLLFNYSCLLLKIPGCLPLI